jgi:hypothetical protein
MTLQNAGLAIVTSALDIDPSTARDWMDFIAGIAPGAAHYVVGDLTDLATNIRTARLVRVGKSKDYTPMFARFCGALSAFNRGCEVVAFLDPPYVPARDYLDVCTELLSRHTAGAVISPVFAKGTGADADLQKVLVPAGDCACGWVLHARAAHLVGAWGVLPGPLAEVESRFMLSWARRANVRIVRNDVSRIVFAGEYPSIPGAGIVKVSPDLLKERLGVRISLA